MIEITTEAISMLDGEDRALGSGGELDFQEEEILGCFIKEIRLEGANI